MNRNAAVASVCGLAICSQLVGCASIISGRSANVAIDSYPANAHVTVRDNNGRAVASTITPGEVSLKRNRKFFLPAKYTARIEAPGFVPADVPIRSMPNPWILGNIALGGIPGLIVDNATGAAWRPKQSEIHQQLMPVYGPVLGPAISEAEPAPGSMPPAPHYTADRSAPISRQ
jgi:hypothetical protein